MGTWQTEFQSSAAYATDDWKDHLVTVPDLLDQIPNFVCDVAGGGADVAGD
jgi:hypothetical protein